MTFFLTREQIGQALEYADPIKAIQKIHLKHQDRLESLCMRIKGSTQIGGDLPRVKNKNVSTTQKEELWRFAAGQDKRMPTSLWIGYGIL